MSVYLISAVGRERRRLELLREHTLAEPGVPHSSAAYVTAALDALDDLKAELIGQLDRQHDKAARK